MTARYHGCLASAPGDGLWEVLTLLISEIISAR